MIKNPDVTVAHPDTWKLIRDHTIFEGIEDADVSNMLPFFKLTHLRPDEVFIEEGQDSTELYLVLKGDLEVFKKADGNENGTESFTIAHLAAGDLIGELSFIKGTLRSASVKSNTRSILLGLDPDGLAKLEAEYPQATTRMTKNILGYIGTRVIQTSANQVQALTVELQNSIRNSKANLFFSYVIGLLCVYNLTIHNLTNLSMDVNRASLISAVIIIIFCLVLVLMIRQTKLPIRIFGLTTRNWKPAVKESLLWSGLIIGAIAATKWILIQTVPRYSHLPLIDVDFSRQHLVFNFLLYGLHSPVQEFIARGVLQGSLQHFFTGRNTVVRAVIVSNALFSATHAHLMHGLLGVLVFVPGLLWGWLYSRHETLIGVSISHMIVGWSALFFFNLESLF